MKISTEKALLDEIEIFTQIHNEMPCKIKGKFIDLVALAWFSHYTKFMGKDGFITPLGFIVLELDASAENPYFALE